MVQVRPVRVVTWAERPELAERGVPSSEVWPEYNLHGDVFDEHFVNARTSKLSRDALAGVEDDVRSDVRGAAFDRVLADPLVGRREHDARDVLFGRALLDRDRNSHQPW